MIFENWIRDAHKNVIKNRFYNCKICNGKGFIRNNKYPHQENNEKAYPTEKCKECNKTGETAKKAVYEKLKEEVEEFNISKPSNIFSKDSEQSEIADIIIVLLAYCGEMKYNISKHIKAKIEFNKNRVYSNFRR